MIFKADSENEIRIRWAYQLGVKGTATRCYIEDYNQIVLASSIIRKDSRDKYDKEKARRLTLKIVLLNYFPSLNKITQKEESYRNHKIRTEIWEAYRMMTKIPRW